MINSFGLRRWLSVGRFSGHPLVRFLGRQVQERPLCREEIVAASLACLSCFAINPVIANAEEPNATQTGLREASPILLSELSSPPPLIESLIQRGDVTFWHGPSDDPRQISVNKPMAAETRYQIEFGFRTRLRWNGPADRLKVTLRRLDLDWKVNHRVWFRDKPESETFWSNPLVLHEMDHVAISSDPSLSRTYRELANAKEPLIGTANRGETHRQASQRMMRDSLTNLFTEVSSLASIRYRELDRQTSHGLRPIPNDSPLRSFYRLPTLQKTVPQPVTHSE